MACERAAEQTARLWFLNYASVEYSLQASLPFRRKRMARLVRLRRILRSSSGVTAVEYAVVIGLLALVCIAGIKTLAQRAEASFTATGGALGNTTSQQKR